MDLPDRRRAALEAIAARADAMPAEAGKAGWLDSARAVLDAKSGLAEAHQALLVSAIGLRRLEVLGLEDR